MLKVRDLCVQYGKAVAVSPVSFTVGRREIVALLGTNGAGKSSLGQGLAGLVPSSGHIEFGGIDLSDASSGARVREGIVYVPEGRRVFPQLTVADNLRAGGFVRRKSHAWEQRMVTMYERVPRLQERSHVKAALLSGGEQQLLAICRALMAHPSLLILDEPSLGLSPRAIDSVATFLADLVELEDLSVVVLEQNVTFASRTAHRALVMQLSHITGLLSEEELADTDRVRRVLIDDAQAGSGPTGVER